MILDFEKAMDAWRGTNKGVDEAFRAELERQAQQAVEAERRKMLVEMYPVIRLAERGEWSPVVDWFFEQCQETQVPE